MVDVLEEQVPQGEKPYICTVVTVKIIQKLPWVPE
jgi:hypothetical protein